MSKRFRLKKDLPGLKAGEIFVYDGDAWYDSENKDIYNEINHYAPKCVHNNPEWFEELKESERVSVKVSAAWGQIPREYLIVIPSKEISSNKYDSIKQAIEQVLNDDNVTEKAVSAWHKLQKLMMEVGEQIYTQEQVDKMMEGAFNAAREQDFFNIKWNPSPIYPNVKEWDSRKYPQFSDYQSSLK